MPKGCSPGRPYAVSQRTAPQWFKPHLLYTRYTWKDLRKHLDRQGFAQSSVAHLRWTEVQDFRTQAQLHFLL
ncbi:hypothetical protein GN956_G17136 [Arapaima gigas]